MRIFPKKQTDAEIVEKTRKHLRISKWLSLFHIAIAAIVLFWFLPKFLFFLIDFFSDLPTQEQYRGWAGFILGLFMGMIFMFIAAQGLHMIVQAVEMMFGKRKDKLFVQYYDALIAIAENQNVSNGLESTGAPPCAAQAMQGRPAAGTPETHPLTFKVNNEENRTI